uniref:Retrovirus-related Pol polyprotein from transposon TNT 1-94-like beta-barrel domain-containing protein n=1 Tax=Cajanus cajan TaxID=3821 RepID=A0A151RS23_CAJCA|nr:hypothetical protein KK1_033114 [Cajanus cajan]
MKSSRIFRDQDYVMRFLMGLNENFAAVKSQVLLMSPLPTLNRAFSMVIQYERQNGLIHSNEENQVMINATDGRRFVGKGRGNSRICTYCGKTGHTVDTCYRKHGFPPSLKSKGSNSSVNCTLNYKDSEYVSTEGINTYTRCYSVKSSNNVWILDFGASDHICSSMEWFVSSKKIQPVSVQLPNGNMVKAHFAGIVNISPSIVLQDVLYVPMFSFNLVSVSKLVSSLCCSLHFSTEACVIQDRHMKMIGSGKQIEGLYYLN